jgi:hypothetical protein
VILLGVEKVELYWVVYRKHFHIYNFRPRRRAYGSTLFEFEKRRAISTAFLALSTKNYGELLATYNF